ncbi:MAG: saccharopine dehydrogenase family protein [Candidatus Hermodarchaeota archaeon]
MGRGLARMLLKEQHHQGISLDLWIYDPYQPAEEQCQQQIQLAQLGSNKNLREHFSKVQNTKLQSLISKPILSSKDISQTLSILKSAVKEIKPRILVNAAPFFTQQIYIPLARQIGSDYIDLGQQLPTIEALQYLDQAIVKAKEPIRIIQESGLAPGLANIFGNTLFEKALSESSSGTIFSVQMRVGGLPQHTAKGGQLHYGPTFSPEGLLYEYIEPAYGLRDGSLISTTTFSDSEYWEDPNTKPLPIGIRPFKIMSSNIQQLLLDRVESELIQQQGSTLILNQLQARPTADGTSKMCFDPKFQTSVQNLEYKTLRFSPHYQTWSKMDQDGTLDETLTHWKSNITNQEISGYPDMVLLRVWAQTTPQSSPHTIELITLHDDIPVNSPKGFTAMQHLTCWPTALLVMALLRYPPNIDNQQWPKLFRKKENTTLLGRTIEQILQRGGIISPYELVDGLQILKELIEMNRIPLIETRNSLSNPS